MKIELLFDDGSDGRLEIDAPDSFTAEQYLKELIERDKPIKPRMSSNKYLCTKCGKFLCFKVDAEETYGSGESFCDCCGHRLGWSEL